MRLAMWRFLFCGVFLVGLFLVVPWIARTSRPVDATTFELSDPSALLDVAAIRQDSKNRALAVAAESEVMALAGTPIEKLVVLVTAGDDRSRRVAAALLGASGHRDGVAPLVHAFRRADPARDDARTIAALATALAESKRTAAIEALIEAIRERRGLLGHEAARALEMVFGPRFGRDATAWERWLATTHATRD
jgi:hypothetical protein